MLNGQKLAGHRGVAAIVGLLGLTLGGSAALFVTSQSMDRIAANRQQQQVEKTIARTLSGAAAQAAATSARMEPAQRIAALGPDEAANWLDNELGRPTVSAETTRTVAILTRSGAIYGYTRGGRADEADLEEIQDTAKDLASSLHASPASEGTAAKAAPDAKADLASIRGVPVVVAASRIPAAGEPLSLVTITYLDDPLLNRWSSTLMLDGFTALGPRTAAPSNMRSVQLSASDGTSLGRLAWRPAMPGEAIREYVIPATLAIGAAVLGLFLMVAYRASNLKDEAETNSQRARYLELFDPITGLVNRTTFIKQLEQIAGSQACQLILLDIDDFSAINEELGHRAGDQVILDFGKQLLKEFQGSQCLVSRLDGDEFAVLIVGNSDIFTLGPRATGIAVTRETRDGTTVAVTISAGIAAAPEHGHTASDLMRHADIALGAAKTAGPERHVVYDPALGEAFKSRKGLEARMKKAIEDEGFELFYQPIISLRTMKPAGVEALLRLKRGAKDTPAVFVPVIEKLGLMPQLGAWIIQQAFRDSRRWPDLRTSINLSPLQLENPALLDQIDFNRARFDVSPKSIGFEITEGVLLNKSPTVHDNLQGLRDRGYVIALDDFGTGYSSLSYLSEFEIHRLKLDQSFVRGGRLIEMRSATLIQGVIDICHKLNIDVVAEGIEEIAEAATLRQWGCDFAQGYQFGKPAPARIAAQNLITLQNNAAAIVDYRTGEPILGVL
ncbi:diguanylate cyclase (GGDEF)-like protein [Novosphingobium sp. PhB55]|nr:diguanylate cyclase (GGDEF)-like protein [Novosphingobium sp. PhB55]